MQFYGFKYYYLIQIIIAQLYGFKYSYLKQIIYIQLYDIKYLYLIQIIFTQLYGFKYSYLILIITWFQASIPILVIMVICLHTVIRFQVTTTITKSFLNNYSFK